MEERKDDGWPGHGKRNDGSHEDVPLPIRGAQKRCSASFIATRANAVVIRAASVPVRSCILLFEVYPLGQFPWIVANFIGETPKEAAVHHIQRETSLRTTSFSGFDEETSFFEEYEDWRFEKEINCRYFDSRWWNNSLSNNRILWILVKFLNWTTSKIGCNCFATFKQEFEDQENWRDWRIFYSVSQRRDYKVEILEKNRETNFEKNLKIKKEKGLKSGTKLETLMQCIRRRISHWNLHVHQESENCT